MMQVWSWIKPLAVVAALWIVLKITGLLAPVAGFTQSTLLFTGVFNASATPNEAREKFDYGFTLRDLEGKTVDFAGYRGKVVFINLWATWCPPCRAEMPSIESLFQKVKDNPNVAFVMLSVDDADKRAAVVRFIQNKKHTFPVFMPGSALPRPLQVSSIPTTLVVAKDGRIVKREIGMRNYDTDQFKQLLNDLAAE
jgi:thiol-disulfide isomerase/thioredoxin